MKFYKRMLLFPLCICLLSLFSGCKHVEKKITVVVREVGSGTREAFDSMVTDGVRYLAEVDENGRTRHNTTDAAVV